jgi:hypothetical protein
MLAGIVLTGSGLADQMVAGIAGKSGCAHVIGQLWSGCSMALIR